jgi:threonine efflux protein
MIGQTVADGSRWPAGFAPPLHAAPLSNTRSAVMNSPFQTRLLSLALLWGVAVIVPGPNFLAVFQSGASQTRRHAYATALGCGCGTAVWGTAGVFGLSFLFTLVPFSLIAIRLAGAGYLVYAGVMLYLTAGQASRAIQPAASPSLTRAFRFGALTTLANPKTMAFAASVFSVSVPRGAPAWYSVVTLTTILAISLSWYILVATLASSDRVARAYLRTERPLKRLAGAMFVGFGLRLAFSRQS